MIINLSRKLLFVGLTICLLPSIFCTNKDNSQLPNESQLRVQQDLQLKSELKQSASKVNDETDTILNFTVASNNSLVPCLRARFSLFFDIKYQADNNQIVSEQLSRINVTNVDHSFGTCEQVFDTLHIQFNHDWILVLNYSISGNNYRLSSIKLKYTVNNDLFPNATANSLGRHDLERNDLDEFNVNNGKSYKCYAKTRIDLNDNVTIEFRNYQGQAFISPDSKTDGFDTAVECVADIVNTNKLVPIIVGIVLAVLIVLVLIAYIIGRKRYRPSYQQV